jgi:hypothetical protein
MSQETIERRFETGTPAQLKLGNIRGQIEIQAGESGFITVTAIKHLDTGNAKLTEIKIEQDDSGTVIVKTVYPNSVSNWFGLNKPCKVDYTLQVPKECNLKVSGVSSGISVQGVQGEMEINTVSGSLKLDQLSGNLKAKTVSGALKANQIAGELDANTVSGSIRVRESQIPVGNLHTVSGRIVLETPLGAGPYTFKSVSGTATLVVPPETACSARFHSVSGRMRTSLPITRDMRRGSKGEIEIQGGGPAISHHCVSGSFKIVTSENEEIHETHHAPAPQVQSKDQMDILKKIEAGQISVEEALKELNA